MARTFLQTEPELGLTAPIESKKDGDQAGATATQRGLIWAAQYVFWLILLALLLLEHFAGIAELQVFRYVGF